MNGHLSLFSGIGGLDLAAEWAGFRTVAFVERDKYCQRVLAKHWPGVPISNDVCEREFTRGEADIISGGFPCQDVSNAGLRSGIAGERSGLYRELVRAIRVVRPRFAVVENVAALLNRGMGTVLGDMAEIGYDTEWDCIPASAVGALHHRERVFITAYSDAHSLRPQRIREATKGPWSREQFEGLVSAELRVSVPAGSSGGVAARVPDRVHRLRALGNAVVPQQAYPIFKAIADIEGIAP